MTPEQQRALQHADQALQRALHRLAVHEAHAIRSTEHVKVEIETAQGHLRTFGRLTK
jgi:hypothetical protein